MRISRETQSAETRLYMLEEQMERLFGEDGASGIIGRMQTDIRQIKELAFKARYVLLGCAISILVMQVLSGSGTVSLQSILRAFAK
jgi:hypothetical protein